MTLTTIMPSAAEPINPTNIDEHPRRTFEYDINPYLKDSNAYGNIYFARYFEWQGICREAWFSDCIFPDMFAMEGAFVTKSAHNDYEVEVYPFQKIKCLVNTLHIRHASFEIHFRFFDRVTNELVSSGHQLVAYVGANKKLMRLSPAILDKVREYEIN